MYPNLTRFLEMQGKPLPEMLPPEPHGMMPEWPGPLGGTVRREEPTDEKP